MKINYIVGDATAPIGTGTKMIVHCCNNQGGWGSGFVVSLSRRWDAPEQAYRLWSENPNASVKGIHHINGGLFELGQIQIVKVESDIMVVNMIGQHRTGSRTIAGIEIQPVDYRSIREGFARIKGFYTAWAGEKPLSLHMPRLGCGLAGGSWTEIEKILNEVFKGVDIEITVYDYAPGAYHLTSSSEFCSEIDGRLIMCTYDKPFEHVVYKGGLFRLVGEHDSDYEPQRWEYILEADFTGDKGRQSLLND